MGKLPDRLISNSEKVKLIREIISDECILLRRTDLVEYLTPYDELDVEVIKDIDFFRMSTNILLCKAAEVGVDNKIKDVNIVVREFKDHSFKEDSQLAGIDFNLINAEQEENLIIGFKKSILEGIKGPYIKGLGTKNQEVFNYAIEVNYDPYVLNCFHMESLIKCTESCEEIERKKITGFMKAIASDIKVKLMNDRSQVLVYNYDDIDE